MLLTILIAIVAIAIFAAYDWYQKNLRINALKPTKTPKVKPRPNKQKQAPSAYRCVVMVNTEDGCQAAKKLQSKLILMNEAATLPLSKCDKQKCNCRYKRYEDRRMQDRRSALNMASVMIAKAQKNRRTKADRRKSDNDYSISLDQQTISII